tara:strand:- start:448 stop:573 length:126 start_codon:yes stop_codon:yes gene_type:complete
VVAVEVVMITGADLLVEEQVEEVPVDIELAQHHTQGHFQFQ